MDQSRISSPAIQRGLGKSTTQRMRIHDSEAKSHFITVS